MDPNEELDLASFSDEDSTDDMDLDHNQDYEDLGDYAPSNEDGVDIAHESNQSLSPNVEPQFSTPEEDGIIGPSILQEMPWDDTAKIVERWLQMYQVKTPNLI